MKHSLVCDDWGPMRYYKGWEIISSQLIQLHCLLGQPKVEKVAMHWKAKHHLMCQLVNMEIDTAHGLLYSQVPNKWGS